MYYPSRISFIILLAWLENYSRRWYSTFNPKKSLNIFYLYFIKLMMLISICAWCCHAISIIIVLLLIYQKPGRANLYYYFTTTSPTSIYNTNPCVLACWPAFLLLPQLIEWMAWKFSTYNWILISFYTALLISIGCILLNLLKTIREAYLV